VLDDLLPDLGALGGVVDEGKLAGLGFVGRWRRVANWQRKNHLSALDQPVGLEAAEPSPLAATHLERGVAVAIEPSVHPK
jgi:hypothetical protein